MDSHLVIRVKKMRLTANRRVRRIDVPWIYHVIRFDGALRIREIAQPSPEIIWQKTRLISQRRQT